MISGLLQAGNGLIELFSYKYVLTIQQKGKNASIGRAVLGGQWGH